jgi:predicted TIM-barrel fold metal-dependent hydrolase
MGADHPVEEVRALDLPLHEREAVLGGNAVRLLGLKEG